VSNAGEVEDPVSKWSRLFIIFMAVQSRLPLSPLAAPSNPQLSDSALTVGGDVSAPVVITRVDAKYTDEALAAGINGIVQLECIIRKNGTVSVTRVVKGLGSGLDENAGAALQQWRFHPAMRNGKAVDVRIVIDIEFTAPMQVGGDVQHPASTIKRDLSSSTEIGFTSLGN
jgi:TonB family protein